MKKSYILFILLTTLSCSVHAQFMKALTNPSNYGQNNDARINVGIIGGANITLWEHFNSAQTASWYVADYKPNVRFGYFGGLAVEYMLNNNLSIGLNAIYEQHNVGLQFINESFPISINQFIKQRHDFTAEYQSIEAYTPLTFYISMGSKVVKPYFFIAPRVSYIIGGNMTYTQTEMTLENTIIRTTTTSAQFSSNTYRLLNIGGTLGIGTRTRIKANNYYFFIKFDISANVNGIHTFTETDLLDEFNYRRFSADTHATLSLLFPIKKQLKGACMRWGEYD